MNEPGHGWDLWRSFLAVLEHGSLSAAARALALTQPTVGRHVAALEARLGTALFTRSRHGLTPTARARALRPQARAMAAAAEALARAASGERDAARGVVRIAASEVVGTWVLPPLLAGLRARHPGLVFELALSNRNEDLLRHEADVAVRMARPTQQALVARRAGTVRVGLYAHRDYLAVHGTPRGLEDALGHALVGIDRDEARLAGLAMGGRVLAREHFAVRCDSDVAQLMAVKAGLGIGACHVALAAADPNLVRVLPALEVAAYEVWVVMHEDLRGTHRVRLVFDHLVAGMGAYVRGDGTGGHLASATPAHRHG